MSFLAEVLVQGSWSRNGVRFATAAEADAAGLDLALRWTLVADVRVAESTDPVNYRWDAVSGQVRLEGVSEK